MKICPITFESCANRRYSIKGIRLLSPLLVDLRDFPYSAEQQRREAIVRAAKMSIQGVQPKLSVRLDVKKQVFSIVDSGGRYLIKPQHAVYPNLPENEALTMRLAQIVGIATPLHGLIYSADGTMSYFVKRFDRVGRIGRLAVEDFAQLSGRSRETKYDCSMEKLAEIIDQYCTFPVVEKIELFKRSLFNYLVGNEDMHLKNFSLVNRNGKVGIAPAYDFLGTTTAFLAVGKSIGDIEEIALPLGGKKKKLTCDLWLKYYGSERLGLNRRIIADLVRKFGLALPAWCELVQTSFLPASQKELYLNLLKERARVLNIVF